MPEMIDSTSGNLNCLFYPFSRLLDSVKLRCLLLIFDSVSFLDEAESADWRRQLFERMGNDSSYFKGFAEIADDYRALEESGAIRILNPKNLTAPNSRAVSTSILADLEDPVLMGLASRPERYGLPARSSQAYSTSQKSRPTWQIFQNKIPTPLRTVGELANAPSWTSHVVYRGDDVQSWGLSYEAGSACAINYYLEASQELGLTPVTTSALHHHMVIRKLKRVIEQGPGLGQVLDDEVLTRCRTTLGQGEILRLLGGIFPAQSLQNVTFKEIVRFRQETAGQRRAFLNEISETIRVLEGDPSSVSYDRTVSLAVQDLRKRLTSVSSELSSARDKLLPSVADATLYGAAGTGALGTLATFLGGLSSAGLVGASALTIGGALGLKAAHYWADRRAILKRQSAGVSYLLAMDKLVK